jgi:Domain of unknown function (DUF1931)
MGVTQFERFFRCTASLDVDKQDLKRYSNFINHKIYGLLVRQSLAQTIGTSLSRTTCRSPQGFRRTFTHSASWMN